MSIAVNCPKCGKAYNVDDRAAGRTVKCRQCGGTFSVAAKAASSDDPFAAMDDLAALGRSDAAVAAAPPPTPRGAPSLRQPPPAPIGVAPPAVPAARPAPVVSYSKAPRRPITLALSDSAAQNLSLVLVLAFIAGVCVIMYKFASNAIVPEGLQSRVYAKLVLSIVWWMFLFFVVMVPLMCVACGLASSWTRWSLPNPAYLRAAGTTSIPFLILLVLLWLVMEGEVEYIVYLIWFLPIVSVLLMIVGLKELMGLKWSSTAVAAGLLLVIVPVSGLGMLYANKRVNPVLDTMVGIDRESVIKYAKAHPEEMDDVMARRADRDFERWDRQMARDKKAAAATSRDKLPGGGFPGSGDTGFGTGRPPGGPRYGPGASTPTAPPLAPDPLVGKIEPLMVKLRSAIADAKTLMKEDLDPRRLELAGELEKVEKPAEWSRLYAEAHRLSAELAEAVSKAPTKTPPPTLFTAIPDRPIMLARAVDNDFATPPVVFRSLVVRPVKGTKIDLKQYARREQSQTWILPEHGVTLALAVEPLRDPAQQRAWTSGSSAVTRLASEKNLFALELPSGHSSETIEGRANGIAWTRVVAKDFGSYVTSATYVGRLPDVWVVARLAGQSRARGESLEIADKFVGALRLAKPGDPPADDPFSPARVVEHFSDVWADPAAVLRQQPKEQVVSALQAYATKMGDGFPRNARLLLEELGGKAAVPMTTREIEAAKPMDVSAAMAGLTSSSRFDQRKAMADLARRTPASDAERELVAAALEALLMKEAFFVCDDVAPALAVWWRPRTISALLPSLEESGDRWQRKVAFAVLPKTKDKSVVFPLIRWIVKEPETVVFALQEMGPVAEDEAIKLLRQKDAAVRSNGARVLEVVGTRKSVAELTRASKDPRDPGAAAAAKRALDVVKDRGDAPAAAAPPPATAATTGPTTTTKPATKPATPVQPTTPPKVGVVPPDDKPDAPAKPGKGWALGQKVQVKWSLSWYDSTIEAKTANGWHLITYDGWSSMEWVESWRIRARGSTADEIGSAKPNKTLREREAAPAGPPGPPPGK